jgi:hypothetical protein
MVQHARIHDPTCRTVTGFDENNPKNSGEFFSPPNFALHN